MKSSRTIITVATVLGLTFALAACDHDGQQERSADSCSLPDGSVVGKTPIPTERLDCGDDESDVVYRQLHDALRSEDQLVVANAVVALSAGLGGREYLDFHVPERAGLAVADGYECAGDVVALVRDELQIQYVQASRGPDFFEGMAAVVSYIIEKRFIPAQTRKGTASAITAPVSTAIEMVGSEVTEYGKLVTTRGSSGQTSALVLTVNGCVPEGLVSSPVEAAEPYVVNSVPGYPYTATYWLDGAVSVSDFAADPSGETWTVYDADLHPVDLSAVNEPYLTYPIPGGAIAMGGGASNEVGYHAVRDGEIVYSLPYSLTTPPIFGSRYALIPEESGCGGTVYDLTTGEAGAAVPGSTCVSTISGHHGLVLTEGSTPADTAVDLRTGELVPTPQLAEVVNGQLTYSVDDTRWSVPVDAADHISVGFDLVAYQVGDEVVVLDARNGSELQRWSATEVTEKQNCILLGPIAADRTLLTCSDNPRSNVAAETVSVGLPGWSQGGGAEGGSV